ncbi:hypothetical protein [Rhodococcus koreensis]|uniref:Uncharacterized protein n=1 Tax=Rhodococcus koreensis TaxID=99653 RepID=A0A1H4M3A3_9NOCA|nr:hypothetical protein [Rhodococcus koreensis]SEB76912.1 hypothetical protein SAMN04490239_1584 [Rhodococcus koreensis]
MAADIETRDTGGGTQPLEQLLSEKFGIKMARLDIERALDALPTIHKASVALPAAEAAMYDAADFGEDQDAYRRKMLDNVAAYTRLLSTARTSAEVSALLEVDPSRIRQRVADRTLWALKDQGKWLFPALQFEPDGPRPGLVRGLDKILSALPAGLHPLAVEGLLTTPQDQLRDDEGKPASILHWLRSGGDIATASGVVEQQRWASA